MPALDGSSIERTLHEVWSLVRDTPYHVLAAFSGALVLLGLLCLFLLLHLVAPKPRAPLPSEKTYRTSTPTGAPFPNRQLPCWYDRWLAERHHPTARTTATATIRPRSGSLVNIDALLGVAVTPAGAGAIEPAELAVSVIVPAYNEELRIEPALAEAVEYLDEQFGRPGGPSSAATKSGVTALRSRLLGTAAAAAAGPTTPAGYEIVVVDDGSTDRTEEVTLRFAREHGLHDVLRYVRLERNRGKGGAVTHGFRHARGEYVLFADADGASRFSDLGKLIEGCEKVVDGARRGVAIGSRAHLVGSEAVVKRSRLRNFLMRRFHFVLSILTPAATSRIRDTQCGFKLFTRATLPDIIPFMHAEGWIFDIEMLMLAESAPAAAIVDSDGRAIGAAPGIRVAEVPVGWREIPGSKLNVVDASVRMALGLAVLRVSWMMGVYRRRAV